MPSGSNVPSIILQIGSIVLVIAVFYLLIFRPQQKQQKKNKEMLNELKVGDRVKTVGGMYGRITRIKDDVITIEVGPQKVELVFSRTAIGMVESGDVETELDSKE